LTQTLEYGIGYYHDGMTEHEKDFIKKLYREGVIRVLIVIYQMSWSIDDLESHLVIILDAEFFNGQENRNVEYSIPDML
jgi:pre-mRNA-splicing helicase BRR2